jgi:hypothetical protein
MQLSFFLFLFLWVLPVAASFGQKIATLEVNGGAPAQGLGVPVQMGLEGLTDLPAEQLVLVEVQGKKRVPVAFQVEAGPRRTMHWVVAPAPGQPQQRVYELGRGKNKKPVPRMQVREESGTLTLQAGNRNLLRYQFETMMPPANVDPAYQRSGFIHPLWSPKGQVLTRVQPPDHYHHYGIWNPWTHVLFEGDTVDFWNLNARTGTVRFAGFTGKGSGPVFSHYEARHEHVALKKNPSGKVALNEVQGVRVYQPQGEDFYLADISIRMTCASASPVKLLEYRYGGLGWRATEAWNNQNSQVLTSEGKTWKDTDGSTARWIMVQGTVGDDHAGVVLMSYPQNYNHPEPLRIWPENQYGRGDMFVNFSPTKNKDWLLRPGQEYTLQYRLLVFNGPFSPEKAEAAWQHFASPPQVTVRKR